MPMFENPDRKAERWIARQLRGQNPEQQASREKISPAQVAALRSMHAAGRDQFVAGRPEAVEDFNERVAAIEAGAQFPDRGPTGLPDRGEWVPLDQREDGE